MRCIDFFVKGKLFICGDLILDAFRIVEAQHYIVERKLRVGVDAELPSNLWALNQLWYVGVF